MFNHAVRFYQLKENPAATVGNMGSEKGIQMNCWTKEEYLRFSEEMMDDPKAYYCFQVLYWCGIRVGELQALFPSDLDLEKKTVTISKTFQHLNGRDLITEPKTPKSNRVVAMPDFLVEEMNLYIRTARFCFENLKYRKPGQDWTPFSAANASGIIMPLGEHGACSLVYVVEDEYTSLRSARKVMRQEDNFVYQRISQELFGKM